MALYFASTSGLAPVDVVVVDFHVEAAGALRQRLADLAEAVDAELLVVEPLADELQRLPAGPGARADHVLALGGAACRAEQQQHGDLGGRDRDAVRGVADLDAARLAGLEIDVVEADGERRDALDVLGDAVDHRLRALLVEREQDGVDRLRRLEHLVDGDLGVVAMRDDVIGLPGAGHDGLWQRPGDQDFLLAHGTVSSPGIAIFGRKEMRTWPRSMPQWGAPDKRGDTPRNSFFTKPRETQGRLATDAAARGRQGHFSPAGREHEPFMLRALVIALALLAGAKIWAQDRLYRDGAQDALLRAYRERAIAACQSEQIFRPGANAARCGRARLPSTSSSDAPASTSASGSCAASAGRPASSTRTSC